MDDLFPTLFTKTFFILGAQIFVTWLAARITLAKFRDLHDWNVPWISSTRNERNQIDLHVDWKHIATPFHTILVMDSVISFILVFFGAHLPLGISFSLLILWSVLTGILMAIALLSVDENLGEKVLAITSNLVFGCAIFGIYSGINFVLLGGILLLSLLCLVLFNAVRLFFSIPGTIQRGIAGVGVIIFMFFLSFCFNHLSTMQESGINDWPSAIRMSI